MAFRRCTVRGRLPGDVFQFGFVLQSDEDIQIMADAVGDAVDGYITARALDHTAAISWDDVVVAELESGTGRVTDVAQSGLTALSTRAAPTLPGQVSQCISILPLTGIATGRFYLPPFYNGLLQTDGSIAASARTDTLNALKTMFDTLSARTSPARLGIWRSSSNSFVGARALSAGSVLDTQRRRRNKRLETRTTMSIAI